MIDWLCRRILFLSSKQSVVVPLTAAACFGLTWLTLGNLVHIDAGLSYMAVLALVTCAVGLGVDTHTWRVTSAFFVIVSFAVALSVALALVQQFEYARLGRPHPLTIRTALELFVPLFTVMAMSTGWFARKKAQATFVRGTALYNEEDQMKKRRLIEQFRNRFHK